MTFAQFASLWERLLKTIHENPEGFTVDNNCLESIQGGYFVAVAATQNSFGVLGLLKVTTHSVENNLCIGGWLNHENNQFYFDSVRVFESGQVKEALAFAKEQGQIAIWDGFDGVEIPVV